MKKSLLMGAALAACLSVPSAEAVERSGFIIGLSVGGGTITCDDCDGLGSVALTFHVGGMLSERLAVLGEGYALAHPEDGGTLSSGIGAGALQFWASDAFWIKGGAGFGQLEVEDGRFSLRSETAFAILAGAGYEIVQRDRFTVDLQARYGSIFFEDATINNISAHVGFNWY